MSVRLYRTTRRMDTSIVRINGWYDSVMRTPPPLLAPLFRSEGQAAILAELLLTGETVGLADLTSRLDLPRSSVHREVSRLADAGLLTVTIVGREWQISANPSSPLTDPVRTILAVAFGPAPMLSEALRAIEGVEVAAIFGSFAARASGIAGPPPRDIDVLVVGTADIRRVYDACREVSEQVKRPVNATVMSAEEWANAVATSSAFANDVLQHPTINLIGDPK